MLLSHEHATDDTDADEDVARETESKPPPFSRREKEGRSRFVASFALRRGRYAEADGRGWKMRWNTSERRIQVSSSSSATVPEASEASEAQ